MITLLTDTVARSGWRIMPNGVALDGFLANPVVLFMHERPFSKHNNLPIGRAVNTRLEDGKLVCDDIEFDQNDKFAKKIEAKWRGGFLNAVSVTVDPVSVSDDVENMLPGQTSVTLTKSELLELSIVDIPNYRDTVKLHNSRSGAEVEDLKALLPKKKNAQQMDAIKNALGLGADATEAQIVDAIKAIQNSAATAVQHRVDALVAEGKANGCITEANETIYRNSATSDFDGTAKAVRGYEGKQKATGSGSPLTDAIKNAAKGGEDKKADPRADWGFLEWSQKDPEGLGVLKNGSPERYKELYAAYVGR